MHKVQPTYKGKVEPKLAPRDLQCKLCGSIPASPGMKKTPSGLSAGGRDNKAQHSTLNSGRLGEPYRADMQHLTNPDISRNPARFKHFLRSKTGVPRAFSGDACRPSILSPDQIITQAGWVCKGSGPAPFMPFILFSLC